MKQLPVLVKSPIVITFKNCSTNTINQYEKFAHWMVNDTCIFRQRCKYVQYLNICRIYLTYAQKIHDTIFGLFETGSYQVREISTRAIFGRLVTTVQLEDFVLSKLICTRTFQGTYDKSGCLIHNDISAFS